MPVQLDRRLVSVDEYYLMAKVGILGPEDRVELIRGEIINMSPIGSKHSFCVNKLAYFFITKLGERAAVSIQSPIRLDDLSEPEPDLAIVESPLERYGDTHPTPKETLLVIEVSDATYEKDKQVKLPLYASAGISEYWIVNLQEEQVEVFRDPQKNTYGSSFTINKGIELLCESLGIKINTEEIFVK